MLKNNGFHNRHSPILRAFSPLSLFSGGAPGAWYDPSDYGATGTLFQDSAGTTPVTAVEQPVGRMLDKSGYGNHAFQSTSASRPVLSARYNLFTRSEDVSVTWTKAGTATTPAANTLNLPASNDYIYQLNIAPAGVALTLSALLSGSGTVSLVAFDNASGGFQTQAVTLTSTPTRYSFNFTFGAGASDRRAGVGRFGIDTATTVTVTNLDIRPANQSTLPYQRVNTATDYATTGFLPYLKFDGVDDSLSTNSISFTSTDKMSVFAGVRKLSDAAVGTLTELSADLNTNNGTFHLFAPASTGAAGDYYGASKGTVGGGLTSAVIGRLAPNTSVVTFIGNISAPLSQLRVNQTVATNTVTQGTGNYGNYPLYIGRRNNASLPFNGQMYSLIIVGKAVTAGELSSTETYVNQKTGAY